MRCSSWLRIPAARPLRLLAAFALAAILVAPASARADALLDWNAIAVNTLLSQTPAVNPFAQARFMAITQLAVFEAVNAITGFDEAAGAKIGKEVASAVKKHNLRRSKDR